MARTLISLRLDDDLRSRLRAAARRRGATPSDLARRAIQSWLDQDEGRSHLNPAESLGELIGRLAGGARDRSTTSDHRLLGGRAAKRRARRGAAPRAVSRRKK